jgi:uncharacterized membrane protein YoaK (UPF0700 family)
MTLNNRSRGMVIVVLAFFAGAATHGMLELSMWPKAALVMAVTVCVFLALSAVFRPTPR